MRAVKYTSLVIMLVSAFVLGWCLFRFVFDQVYEDYLEWMTFYLTLVFAPLFLVALSGYIVAEIRISRK